MPAKKSLVCTTRGCRRKPVQNGLCAKHAQEAASPMDAIEKMSDIEALGYKALDLELRNMVLTIKQLELEIAEARRKYQEETLFKTNQRKQVEALFNAKQVEYKQMVRTIAEKRGLDPEKMALDPDAKTVRDLRNEN
jgi:hypothetical protein